MQKIGTLPAPYNVMSVADGINDSGQVVGGSYNHTSGYASRAFLYSGGSLQNLGTLPGKTASVATAINNAGEIVGQASTNGNASHAFLLSGGPMQDLGAGEAYAINNLGQVVGYSSAGSYAFLYSGGSPQNLNSLIPSNSGWTLTEATGINDSGQICGYGEYGGQTEAFLLTRASALQGQWGVNSGGSWNTAGNWTGCVPGLITQALGVPTGIAQDTALFGAALTSGTAMVILDGSRSLGGLSFSTTGGASYVISPSGASTLILLNSNTAGSATISNSGGNNTINAPITLGSNLSVSAATGSLLTIAGGISGSGAVTQMGPGTLILTGANTYSGATTISAGTLQIGDGGATDSLPISSSIVDNGTLVFNRSNTVTQGTDFSTAGISGTGSLTQAGPGLLVLNASNTYTGGTTISAGTLQVGNGGSLGTSGTYGGYVAISSGALFNYNSSATQTLGGVISGGGAVTQMGPGTLILTGSNTYSGPTTISAGTLQIGNGGVTGSLSISSPIADNGTLVFNRSNTVTQGTDFTSAGISGTGSLEQAGAGTLVLNASNTYTGTTTISAGTLQVGNGGTLGTGGTYSGNVAVSSGALFNYSSSATQTLSGVISGGGLITQMGPGILILTGANTYSGGTTVSAGTLQIDNGGTTGSLGSGNVTNNAVLAFNRADNYTFAGNITGSGSLVMNGPGTLVLTGSVLSGQITLNQGQIVAGPGSITTGDLTIPAAGRFMYSGSSLYVTNLSNSGTFLGGAQVSGNFLNSSSGDVRIAAGQARVLTSTISTINAGSIEVFGTGASQAQFESAAPFTNASGSGTGMIAAQNATLHFDGGVTNQGLIAFSGGASNVFGEVTNSSSGTIVVSGGAVVTFYNDVVQNGTLNVSASGGTSSVVFLGTLSGTGTTTADKVFLMGDLRPGDSMGAITVNGNAYMAGATNSVMELTGTAAGSQYNQIHVTGTMALDGTLSITLPNPGYRPTQGAQFQVMTFGSCTGAFTSINGLNLGNRLELVPAYTNNALTLTAVQGGSGMEYRRQWRHFGGGQLGHWGAQRGGRCSNLRPGHFRAADGHGRCTDDIRLADFPEQQQLHHCRIQLHYAANAERQPADHRSGRQSYDLRALVLAGNLAVSTSVGNSLELTGNVSGEAASLTLSGGGELILSGSDSYGGGTVVNAGTLYVTNSTALPNDTSLTVGAGGTFVFDPSLAVAPIADSPLAVNGVPEPSTIALLVAGALWLLAYAWRRRQAA